MEVQLKRAERDIIVYPKRSRIFKTFIALVITDSVVLLCLFQFSFSVFSAFLSFSALPAYAVTIICSVYLIELGMLVFVLPPLYWLNFVMLRTLLSPQSILNIGEEGIKISAQPIIKSAFVSWNNIAEIHLISLSSYQGTNLSLIPRDVNSLFSSRFQRICWRWISGNWLSLKHLLLGAWLLTMPNQELCTKIQNSFKEELSRYEIQLKLTR